MRLIDLESRLDQLISASAFGSAKRLIQSHLITVNSSDLVSPFAGGQVLSCSPDPLAPLQDNGSTVLHRLAQRLRNARYDLKILGGFRGLRIIELGDAWTQQALFMFGDNDVLSHRYAVRSQGGACDRIENIAGDGRYILGLEELRPHVLILSLGGNDLIGSDAIARIMDPTGTRIDPPKLALRLDHITGHIRSILSSALQARSGITILLRGYDCRDLVDESSLKAVENRGGSCLPITTEMTKAAISALNMALRKIAESAPNSVRYVKPCSEGALWDGDLVEHQGLELRTPSLPLLEFISEIEKRVSRGAVTSPSIAISNLEDDRYPDPQKRGGNTPNLGCLSHKMATDNCDTLLPDTFESVLRANRFEKTQPASQSPSITSPKLQRAFSDLAGLIRDIDLPECDDRVETRMHYSSAPQGALLDQVTGARKTRDFGLLVRAQRIGGAVALLTSQSWGKSAVANGVLIGPGLLLTPHSVVPDRKTARKLSARFGYETMGDGTPARHCSFDVLDDCFLTSRKLGYSVLSLAAYSDCGRRLEDLGYAEILPLSGKALKREYVNSIQHTNGQQKTISTEENMVLGCARQFLYLAAERTTDRIEQRSVKGALGAPIFNSEWQLAGIQHSTVSMRAPNDGYVANRAVRISAICDDISRQALGGCRDAVLVERILKAARNRMVRAIAAYGG